jgi:hypothetical protein
MTRAELVALASPPCHDCGEPVVRVEIPYELSPGGEWVPRLPAMVCAAGHRVLVEPFV